MQPTGDFPQSFWMPCDDDVPYTLWALVQKMAFTEVVTNEELEAFKIAWGLTETSGGDNSGTEDGGEDEPIAPTVTLTSISATYSGGDVVVGTNVNELSGITVKAHYSDGTSKTVTDYTLSGSINEGNNTITVSYQGKSTTFTVVGYVESTEPTNLYNPSTTQWCYYTQNGTNEAYNESFKDFGLTDYI